MRHFGIFPTSRRNCNFLKNYFRRNLQCFEDDLAQLRNTSQFTSDGRAQNPFFQYISKMKRITGIHMTHICKSA